MVLNLNESEPLFNLNWVFFRDSNNALQYVTYMVKYFHRIISNFLITRDASLVNSCKTSHLREYTAIESC